MKNSFWSAVGVRTEIKPIDGKTISDAVLAAYNGSEYRFFSIHWFIDVKDSFRIFNFKGTPFIVKESSSEKADKEVAGSNKANERLGGKTVGTKEIRIVVPQKITLTLERERYFLVSEYVGTDMHEGVYTDNKPEMSLEVCLYIVNLLLKNGITHIAYLPRNIVEKDDSLYLFDWESAIFTDDHANSMFDHLWKTNFLLNWSYLFSYRDLDEGLSKAVLVGSQLVEPPLVKYEHTFRGIVNYNNNKTSHSSLRDMIDEIVFGSELPLIGGYDQFYIRPNDMGHLVSDIFPDEIDVLHDMLSCVFRAHNEFKYFYNLQLMTCLLILYYKEALILNHVPKLSLEYYTLVPILMMIDDYIAEGNYENILSVNSLSGLITRIFQIADRKSTTKLYLSGEVDDLPRSLDTRIRDRIIEACPRAKAKEIGGIDKMITYILKESTQACT